jgi:hypothetical protein
MPFAYSTYIYGGWSGDQYVLKTRPIAFVSVRSPGIDLLALEQEQIKPLDLGTDGKSLKLPIVHIWNPEDSIHPGFGGASQALRDSETMEEAEHDLSHEVPGRGSSYAVAECSRAINRTIERASVC